MQLKIQRSQRVGGVIGSKVFFCLDVRADYSPEESRNIQRYRLGPEIIYSSQTARKHIEQAKAHMDRTHSRDLKEQLGGLARGAFSMALAKMSLNITIESLGYGHHIECKDLQELSDAEDTVRQACKDVTRYLQVAATFDGSETVIDYENGEEREHIIEHAPVLISYQPDPEAVARAAELEAAPPPPAAMEESFEKLGQELATFAVKLKGRWIVYEDKLMALAAAKKVPLNKMQVRVLAGAVGCFVLLVLVILIGNL